MKTTKWQPPPIYGMDVKEHIFWTKTKPYLIMALLTIFLISTLMAGVNWGQHHCIKHHKVKRHR